MRYTIAGIGVDIPETLLAGAFARALAPFAAAQANACTAESGHAPEIAAGTVSDKNRAGVPDAAGNRVPGIDGAGNSGIDGSGKQGSGSAGDGKQGSGIVGGGPRASALQTAAANASYPEKCGGPTAQPCGTTTPQMRLRQGVCPPPQADYRELDRFDFADADADCRFGHDALGYLLEMTPRGGAAPARFRKRCEHVEVTTDFTTAHHPALLRFGVWIAYNLAAAEHGATAFHASVIACKGRAVLFLGESGTGKSTHTRLWREHVAGASLLNDDSPIVRISTEGTTVCGSPWSGKTPCYRNEELPVAGIVRLSQAPHNRIRRLRTLEAIGALLPSVPPAFARDERLQDALCRIVSHVVRQVPVYHLECLPDAAAARLVYETLFEPQPEG